MHDRPENERGKLLRAVTAIEERLARIEQLLIPAKPDERSNWQKFRTRIARLFVKLGSFEHYRPREMRVPPRYLNVATGKNPPSFRVVTPCLNPALFIRETIESVLDQNYPKLTYLIQDCLSDDGTKEIVEAYKDRLVIRRELDTGQANAINRAFENTDADIMFYLNSDDLLLPGALAYVANYFDAHPDIDIVYGHRVVIDAQTLEIGRWIIPPHDAEAIKWADFIPQETLFWRKRVWDRVGKFDESFEYALDWDFILRAQALGFKFKRLPRFLGCFRVHNRQKTSSLLDVGTVEMRKLRTQYLGRKFYLRPVHRAILGYIIEHVALNLLYRLGIVRY